MTRDLRRDLRKILPCERFGAFATDRAYFFARFSRYVISDLRPMGGVGYPAGVAIVDDCARGCVLGSERKSKRPEEHMPPRLRRKLPSINISAGERSESRELRILQHSTCDMYSSSSCDGGTHVLSTLIRKVYPTYRIYNSCSESYACVCTSKYVMYSRRCDMYSTAAV